MGRAHIALCGLLLVLAGAAVATPAPAPLPDADVQARCAAEGGCVLITRTRLANEIERAVRAARDAAAASCRRGDLSAALAR